MKRRRNLRTTLLYGRTLVRRFRWTLLTIVALVAAGTVLYAVTPHQAFGGRRMPVEVAAYSAWMALIGEPAFSPPETWYLEVLCATYPLFGFVVIGEGVVRLGILMTSRERNDKEWMRVMASTYRDHVVLCGLGHLGSRILQHLVERGVPVVALEKAADARFLPEARELAPVLIRDIREDAALVEAGVKHARAIILATNDDMANLEVAIDAQRLNPQIRILLRMYDQQIAQKIKDALGIAEAFSSAALAAPIVVSLLGDEAPAAAGPRASRTPST